MSYYDDFIDGHEFDEIPYKRGWELERPEYKSTKKRTKIHKMIRDLSNDELCEKYFENYDHKEILNKIVPGSKFPAYDVAVKCYDNQWMSPKQREALENVFLSYFHKYKRKENINGK